MSKHISKEISETINKEELKEYYYSHLPKDTMAHFNIPSHHILNSVLTLLEIERMSPSCITKLQLSLMTPEEKEMVIQKAVSKTRGLRRSEEIKAKYREAQKKVDHSHLPKAGEANRFKKGNSPWNKGMRGCQKWVEGQAEKRIETLRKNKTFNSSKPEEDLYKELCIEYGKENVIRQYKDERYSFACDFYIKSDDLFIELNRSWTHGGHPFNESNEDDLKKLSLWKEKAKTSDYYKVAIYVWTELDTRKQKTAKENNLNYLCIY